MCLYIIGKWGYIFSSSIKFISEVYRIHDCHVHTIIMQFLLCTRYVGNIWRNAHLPRRCMDANSIENISKLSQGRDRDLQSWFQMLGEIFIDLFFFCCWTWGSFHHFLSPFILNPVSSLDFHVVHLILSSSQAMCIFSLLLLFLVFPALHWKIATVGQTC